MRKTMLAWLATVIVGVACTACTDTVDVPEMRPPTPTSAVVAPATTTAAPYVSPDDEYLTALALAGVNYGTRDTGVELGRTICPAIQAGATFQMMIDAAEGNFTPADAAIIVIQAHQVYCPSAVLR